MKVDVGMGVIVDIASGEEMVGLGKKIDMLGDRLMKRDPRPMYNTKPGSVIAAAGVPTIIPLGGPSSGRVWDIRQLITVGPDDHASSYSQSAVGAPAGAASVTLPQGASLSHLTITGATAAAPVSGLVTITGVSGGTVLTYEVTFGVSGNGLDLGFTPPLSAVTDATSIVVTVAAIAGGSAYWITTQAVFPVAWYTTIDVELPQILVPGLQVVPFSVVPASAESIFLHFGEVLTCVVHGMPAGMQAVAIARIADWPDGVPEGRRFV